MPGLVHEDFLYTIAEVAAAFVGFSMIVGLLSSDPSDRHRFYSIRDVAEVGLTSLGAALLPTAIHAFGLGPETTWRLASTLFFLGWVTAGFIGIRRSLRAGAHREAPRFLVTGPIFTVIGNLLLGWNVLLPGPLAPARYVLGLLLLLTFAGLSFISATFHGRTRGPDDAAEL